MKTKVLVDVRLIQLVIILIGAFLMVMIIFFPYYVLGFVVIASTLVYALIAIKRKKENKKLEKLCLFFEDAPIEEQELIVELSGLIFYHVVCRIGRELFHPESAKSFHKFLATEDLLTQIKNSPKQDRKAYYVAVEIIHDFLTEHRNLIKEDRIFYKKGIVYDEYIGKERWRLERWVASFKARWRFWPILDPYVE